MGSCTVRVGDAEPILIRDAPPSSDDERDRTILGEVAVELGEERRQAPDHRPAGAGMSTGRNDYRVRNQAGRSAPTFPAWCRPRRPQARVER